MPENKSGRQTRRPDENHEVFPLIIKEGSVRNDLPLFFASDENITSYRLHLCLQP